MSDVPEEKAFLVDERWRYSPENRDYVQDPALTDDENVFVDGVREDELQPGMILILRKTNRRVRGTLYEAFYWERV